MMTRPPDDITVCNLECIVMPNGEVITAGKTIGFLSNKHKGLDGKNHTLGKYITPKEDK